MDRYQNLAQILITAGDLQREIRFIDGDKDETLVSFAMIRDRAVSLLGSLQAHGMKAGDELVIFTRSNEHFVIAFWAAILGASCRYRSPWVSATNIASNYFAYSPS